MAVHSRLAKTTEVLETVKVTVVAPCVGFVVVYVTVRAGILNVAGGARWTKGKTKVPADDMVTTDLTTAFAVDTDVGVGWNTQVSGQTLQVAAAALTLWHSVTLSTWSFSPSEP